MRNNRINGAAIAIVWNKERSKLLLVKRCDVPIWVLPGGGVDAGESFEEAAVREVKEETGLEVVVEQKAAIYTPVNRLSQYTEVFICSSFDSALKPCPKEVADIGFFSLDELPDAFFFVHRYWVEDSIKSFEKPLRKDLDYVSYRGLFCFICRHPIWFFRFAYSRFCR